MAANLCALLMGDLEAARGRKKLVMSGGRPISSLDACGRF
jgi:hypothetical protein